MMVISTCMVFLFMLDIWFPQVRHELKGYWPALNIELPQSLLATCRRPRPPEVSSVSLNCNLCFVYNI